MCGLCGIIGPNMKGPEWDVFKDLMIVSTLRGEDGAGIIAVPMKGGKDFEVLRTEGCAADLVTGLEFLKLRKGNWACFMGHARQPTSGTWGMEDVHPHISGPIYGMHNGTMLRVNGTLVGKDDNDSRLLFNSIRNTGIENTVRQSHGAYALSYLNKATDQLCFIRNKARPLYFMQVAGLPHLMWASERWFLDMIASRTPGLADKAISIYNLAPDHYLTFRIHNAGPVKYVDFRSIEKAEAVPEMPQKSNTVYETKHGSFLDELELKMCLQSGCAYCSQPMDMTDYQRNRTFWYAKNEFICHDCATHDPLARDYLMSSGVTPPAH